MLEQLHHSSAVIESGVGRENMLLPKLPTIYELSDQMGTSTCPGSPSFLFATLSTPPLHGDEYVVSRHQLIPPGTSLADYISTTAPRRPSLNKLFMLPAFPHFSTTEIKYLQEQTKYICWQSNPHFSDLMA